MRILPLISVVAVVFLMSGCQSAFRIPAESLPKKLFIDNISLISEQAQSLPFEEILKNHKTVVVIFWQTKCPCVRRYQTRINDLYHRYKNQGIAFMHLSSNSFESFPDVLAEYQKREIPMPLFRDEGGRLKIIIGAKSTPTAAIINNSGELLFLGWIDNERSLKESHRIAYLENALLDIVNERPVSVPTSPMFGCGIH